jgi:hypothetical protein
MDEVKDSMFSKVETGIVIITGESFKYIIKKYELNSHFSIPTGYGTGYVEFRDESVDHYNDLDIRAHGDLTFIGKATGIDGKNDGSTYIGFDTAHYGDGRELDYEFMKQEIWQIAEQVYLYEMEKGIRTNIKDNNETNQ